MTKTFSPKPLLVWGLQQSIDLVKKVDIYIMDLGGLGPGCEDSIMSLYRSLIDQVKNKPSCLFVIYSQFTQSWYEDAMRTYAPELKASNVIYWAADNCIEMLRKWADCDEFKIREEHALTKITKCVTPGRRFIATKIDNGGAH